MSKVTQINTKKEMCAFCGDSPDHDAFWGCPRLKTVTMDPDGSWSVEFVDPEYWFEFEAEDGD